MIKWNKIIGVWGQQGTRIFMYCLKLKALGKTFLQAGDRIPCAFFDKFIIFGG